MKTPLLPALFAAAVLSLGMTGEAMTQDFRNFDIGAIRLTALTDFPPSGPAANPPVQLLVGLSDAERAAVTGERMVNAVNMFVLRAPGGNYLFDTGVGQESGGGMLAALAAAGLGPADISAVVITHFHGDHIGGLTKAGQAVFANARLYVPRGEMEKGPSSAGFAAAYAGKTTQFDWGAEILPGVTPVASTGHTNGHTSYMIANGGNRLFIAGDLIHFGGVQLPNPDIAVTYDTDPAKAVAARRAMFDMVAGENIPMATMHLPFPGVGMLTKAGSGYDFAPLP